MQFKKQVNREHYSLRTYYKKDRWCSMWHQLDEVKRFDPESVLEVGGGLGLFKSAMACFGLPVTIVDIAEDLNPDIIGSVTDLPVEGGAYDVTCAFQVLEHLPFEQFLPAMKELRRVGRKGTVISLPDAKPIYGGQFLLPKLGRRDLWLPFPFKKTEMVELDGQHHWEVHTEGCGLDVVIPAIKEAGFRKVETFRVPENLYHRFFRCEV